ncbi:MAG: pyridoxal-phosphate dependent enzyme [Gammaproteobacteria bacterium]|nr:pyridoxal-phosphate dependent enzyme [Gammaproteobacteria bacterium]
MSEILSLSDIRKAAARIQPYLHRTPVMTSQAIDKLSGARCFFKCENFQKVGAFKARGALNAVLSLPDESLKNGVATHSSGNHAAALAMAAQIAKVPAYIVMPGNAPVVKKNAVESYGANITYCEANLQARENGLADIVAKTGAEFIPPFDDDRIICGQATVAMELIEDVKNLDLVIAPVGGGGLLSGTALSTHYLSPNSKVIAAEPEGANDTFNSFSAGKLIPVEDPCTIADGLLTSLSERTFAIIKDYVEQIVTVSDDTIVSATRLIMERMKIVVEPSAAVALAAILEKQLEVSKLRIGIILSGGNIDFDSFYSGKNGV